MASALRDDAGLKQGLDQDAEDICVLGHLLSAIFVAEVLQDCVAHPDPVEIEFLVDILLLLSVDQIEEEDLEGFGGPQFYVFMLFFIELGDRLVGPDLAEFVVEGFVAHREMDEAAQHRIVRFSLDRGEGTHGEALDQHLHTDEFLVNRGGLNDLVQEIADGCSRLKGGAPSRRNIVP